MNVETLTSIFMIFLGLFGFYSSHSIKKENIEKEELSGESKKSGYIPLRARKEKSLIVGIGFTVVGILFLIKSII